ncbi:radical SAM protein [bacterium]|nr:radical SAM protein [bacterium]
MNKHILLINPWIHDFAALNMWIRPLGLLQTAEFLSAYNVDLSLIDCLDTPVKPPFHMGQFPRTVLTKPAVLKNFPRTYARYGITPPAFTNKLKTQKNLDAIFITSMMAYWYPGVFEVIGACRKHFPKTPIILGGIYPQLFPAHAMVHSQADAVYLGPVDETLIQVLHDQGIAIHQTRDTLPFYNLGFYKKPKYAPLLTSEGCPYTCAYCACPILHPHFSQKKPKEITQAIFDQAAMGVLDFAFYDDALLHKPEKHIQPILQAVIDTKLAVRFHTPNGLHARFIDAKTAQLMFDSGFKTVRLSLETINASRQSKTGGKVMNAEFKKAVQNLKKAGFTKKEIGVYIMYGLPGQPAKEVMESIAFLEKLNVRIHLCEFSPIPGTPLWDELIRKKIIPEELDPLLTNNSVFSVMYSAYTKAEIKLLKDTVAQVNQRA